MQDPVVCGEPAATWGVGTQPCDDPPVARCTRCHKPLCQTHLYTELGRPFCRYCRQDVGDAEQTAWGLFKSIVDWFRS